MKSTRDKAVGWLLITLGILTVACSSQIVSPGLERLLGIETIVGRNSVVYDHDGSYIFTNPDAMARWIAGIAAVGLVVAFIGSFVLFRARPAHTDSHVHVNVA